MAVKICGTGSCLPKNQMTNDDLSKIMDTSDEWIKSRTGIRNRHIAKEETTTSMSVVAARQAMEQANLLPEDIDLILAATLTPDNILPTLSCEIQREIGAIHATAFDIGAACSGFLFALNTAYAYITSGLYKNVLVVGAEVLSKVMNWDDRSTCVLFGDGAGAAIVRDIPEEEQGMYGFIQGSDGARGMALSLEGRQVNNPCIKNKDTLSYVLMNGQEVYKFAVKTVPNAILQAIEQSNLSVDEIDHFILHQANIRIIESVAKRLHQPLSKFPINLDQCGNMSAASVPVLLDWVNRDGKLKKGDKIVLAGFGAGLTWGAAVLTW